MRVPVLLLAWTILVPTPAEAESAATAALLVGTWEAVDTGARFEDPEVHVTFSADGSGLEIIRVDGNETRLTFDWQIDDSTPIDTVTIALGEDHSYDIPLRVIDPHTIVTANPASANLPSPRTSTFVRVDASAPSPPLAAGPVPFTLPPEGLVAEYSNGLVVTVLQAHSNGVVVVQETTESWGSAEMTYAHGIEWLATQWRDEYSGSVRARYDFDVDLVAAAWPLTPGYDVRYQNVETIEGIGPMTLNSHLRVVGYQAYDGPVGDGYAAVVKLDIDYEMLTIRCEYWFVTGFGLPVRSIIATDYDDGGIDRKEFNLVSFRIEN